MNKGLIVSSSPVTKQMASRGVPWATKLLAKGWSSLTPSQKRAALAATNLPSNQEVVFVNRPRVRNPPIKGDRNGPGQAGKSLSLTQTEFVGDVIGYTGLEPHFRDWVINPGSVLAAPSISLMSQNFDKYKITNFKIRFSSTRSDNENGKIGIVFTHDAGHPLPTNKSQFYNMGQHNEGQAKNSFVLNVPSDNKVRWLRDTTSDEPKLVDFGRVVLTTYGFDTDNIPVGELFFDYTVVFSEPTFAAKISQVGDETKFKGPTYGAFNISDKMIQLAIGAPGHWLIVFVISDLEGATPPTSDSASIIVRVTSSDVGTTFVLDVETNTNGAVLKFDTPSRSAVGFYSISRM